AVDTTKDPKAHSYYAVDGKMPFQLYYPRVRGYWPKTRYRLLWSWFFDIFERQRRKRPGFYNPIDWEGVVLPGIIRSNHHTHMYSRWVVPVEANLTWVIYTYSTRPSNALGRL